MMNKRTIDTLQLLAVGVMTGVSVLALSITPSRAQMSNSTPQDRAPEVITVPQKIEDTFFGRDPKFTDNQHLGRRLGWIFGIGFPDNEIVSDVRNTNELYRELLKQQESSDPVLRTNDLPNPFNSSLYELMRTDNMQPIPYGR